MFCPLVIGVPMDFRLGFGAVFGADTQLVVADRVAPTNPIPVPWPPGSTAI